jgi:hypothetical protein
MDKLKKINIFDSFLTNSEYKEVTEKVNNLTWTYGHTSTSDVNALPFWNSSLNDDPYFAEYLFNIIKKTVKEPLILERVYCNGLTYGQNGTYHTDSNDPNSRTFMIYVHDIPPEDYDIADGYLYFKFSELDYNILYEPIKNRGIYFPGNYVHKANGFSRFIKTMRRSVVWKTHIKKDIENEII